MSKIEIKANAYLVPDRGIIRIYDNLDIFPAVVNILGKDAQLNNILNCIEVPLEASHIIKTLNIKSSTELTQFIDTQTPLDIPTEEYWQSLLKGATLRDFQCEFLCWFESRRLLAWSPKASQRGVICALACGTGKSVTSLATDAHLRKQGLIDKTLIVCRRNNEFTTWTDHLDKYIKLPYVVIEGNAKERSSAIAECKKKKTKLALIHYEAIRKHGKDLAGLVEHLIIDEAQHIANPASQQSIATDLVAQQAKYTLMLSGGVAQNRIATQLYHPLHLCNRKMFPSFNRWRDDWCITELLEVPLIVRGRRIMDSDKKPVLRKIQQIVGIRDPEALAKEVSLYMFQRDITTVASQLPEVTRQVWGVELSKRQKQVYLEIRDSVSKEVAGLSVSNALTKILRLHQALGTLASLGLEDESSKADTIAEFVVDNIPDGCKVLIFSQWVKMVSSIYSRLKEQDINVLMMTGDTSETDRTEIRQQFRTNPLVKALVTTTTLESTGGSYEEANYVIMADRVHQVLVNIQAESRVIRLTSKLPITIINFITMGTIEEVQAKILSEKLEAIRDIMEPAHTYTQQDIDEMLSIKPK